MREEYMRYGLGIDVGGTYTDSVIYDFEAKEVVCFAKSVTDKEDLKRGINKGLEQLPGELLSKVELVALSTTLATNACIEGGHTYDGDTDKEPDWNK